MLSAEKDEMLLEGETPIVAVERFEAYHRHLPYLYDAYISQPTAIISAIDLVNAIPEGDSKSRPSQLLLVTRSSVPSTLIKGELSAVRRDAEDTATNQGNDISASIAENRLPAQTPTTLLSILELKPLPSMTSTAMEFSTNSPPLSPASMTSYDPSMFENYRSFQPNHDNACPFGPPEGKIRPMHTSSSTNWNGNGPPSSSNVFSISSPKRPAKNNAVVGDVLGESARPCGSPFQVRARIRYAEEVEMVKAYDSRPPFTFITLARGGRELALWDYSRLPSVPNGLATPLIIYNTNDDDRVLNFVVFTLDERACIGVLIQKEGLIKSLFRFDVYVEEDPIPILSHKLECELSHSSAIIPTVVLGPIHDHSRIFAITGAKTVILGRISGPHPFESAFYPPVIVPHGLTCASFFPIPKSKCKGETLMDHADDTRTIPIGLMLGFDDDALGTLIRDSYGRYHIRKHQVNADLKTLAISTSSGVDDPQGILSLQHHPLLPMWLLSSHASGAVAIWSCEALKPISSLDGLPRPMPVLKFLHCGHIGFSFYSSWNPSMRVRSLASDLAHLAMHRSNGEDQARKLFYEISNDEGLFEVLSGGFIELCSRINHSDDVETEADPTNDGGQKADVTSKISNYDAGIESVYTNHLLQLWRPNGHWLR